jgi:hypothetical protein
LFFFSQAHVKIYLPRMSKNGLNATWVSENFTSRVCLEVVTLLSSTSPII